MADRLDLSEGARRLLRLRLDGQRADVSVETREAYRELVRAGLMVPVSTFIGGPESLYRLTQDAVDRREEFRAAPQHRRFSASEIARSMRRAWSWIGKGVSAAP